MLTEASSYDELYRDFRWDVPARFNMATACCDRHADGSGRLALIYVNDDGTTTRTSFDEVAEMSRRFANVLVADGLKRGDRVAVFLSQSLELPVAHLAAFRGAMISIPLFALFGEDALEFRLSNSGAKAIVTDQAGWEKLSKIRDRLPELKNIYVIGGLELNEDTKEVSVDGEPVKVTPTEYKILLLLMKNAGRVFSAEEIYEWVWQERAVNTDTIMVHVRNIREKIEINPKEPKYLKVVWGVGYKIEKQA